MRMFELVGVCSLLCLSYYADAGPFSRRSSSSCANGSCGTAAMFIPAPQTQATPTPFGGTPPFKLFIGTMAKRKQVGDPAGYLDLATAERQARFLMQTQFEVDGIMVHDAADVMIETVRPDMRPSRKVEGQAAPTAAPPVQETQAESGQRHGFFSRLFHRKR